MADNETRIKITAVDNATATLNALKGKVGEVVGGFRKLAERERGDISVAGFAATVTAAVNAADAMDELSQKTGIAVEKLSALDYAMRREGVSTEAFAKGVKELSKNMVEAGDASSKAGKLFAELGVNAKGDTRDALLKIADTFAKIPDGATKAALATELFGKAGQDLIPALNNGAEGLREMEEQARRLGVTLDTDTARAAAKLKDDLFALTESSKALGNSVARQLVQPLRDVTAAMREAVEQGGLLQALWVGLGGIGNLIINGTEIQQAQREVEKLTELVGRLEQSADGAEGKALENIIKALDEVNPKLEAARARLKELTSLPPPPVASSGDKKAEGRIAGILGSGAGKAAVDTFAKSLEALENRLDSVSAGFSADFAPAVTLLNNALAKGAIDLERYEDLMAKLVKQQPIYKAGLEAQAKLEESVAKALADGAEERRKYLASIDAEIEKQRFANEILGLTEEQVASLTVARLEEKLAILQASGALEDETAALAEEIAKRKELRDLIGTGERRREQQAQTLEDLRNQAGAWDDLSSRAANFFGDLVINGRDAFKSLKDSLKGFAAELIALFAKRYILQLGAQLTGNPVLGNLAGSVGQGSFAGSLLSNAGSLLATGANALGFGGVSQFIGGATGAIAGPALPGSALAAGQGFGGTIAAAGPYVAAIVAAYMLYNAFKDKGENWKGRIGFGDAATAYSVDGVFGRQGFQYLAGNDAVNRQIQGFFASTLGIDDQLARNLSPEQIAAIRSGLLTYNTAGTRADGQPAEFAFGKGDDTAAAQLTLEFLKQKYSVVFDTIDTDFAEFIRGYTGTSEDLLKAIGEYAVVLNQLDSLGIPGFDMKALKAFQREGESLSATFARVAQQFGQYQELFLTEGEKIALAQKNLGKAFADLGIEMPKTNEEFKKLVAGLDLSTEEGRALFAALMELAPAFAGVTNAAAAMLGQFNQIVASRNPSVSRQFVEQDLEGAVRQFMARNPWTQGMDWRAVAQQINLLPTFAGGRADFERYSPEDQALILRILGLTDDLEGLGDAASGAGRALSGMGPSIAQAIESWSSVKRDLWDFLRGLYLDPQLSVLDPNQQLEVAKSRFTDTLAAANGGDISAAASLPDIIEQVLSLGRTSLGSGPGYVDLFNWITGLAGDFVQPGGGMDLQRLAFEEARSQTAQLTRQTNIMADVRALLIDIRDRGTAGDAAIAASVTNAALATERK